MRQLDTTNINTNDKKHNMKKTFYTTLMLTSSLITFSQAPKKTTTVIKAETKYNEAVKTQQYLAAKESNDLAKESLIKLNDTTLSESEREIHINNYRKSIRNGNAAIKKKSYDLTKEENEKEVLDLSKSPKFNKKAKQTCIAMHKKMTTPYDQFADERFRDFKVLSDSTQHPSEKNIKEYIAFKINYEYYSSIALDKRKEFLIQMSTDSKFSKETRELCLKIHEKDIKK